MNTALYNPPRPLKSLYPDPNQPSDVETEEEKDEAKSGSSGKGDNDSSSSVSPCDMINFVSLIVSLTMSQVDFWVLPLQFVKFRFYIFSLTLMCNSGLKCDCDLYTCMQFISFSSSSLNSFLLKLLLI